MPPKKKEAEKPVVDEKFQRVEVSTQDPRTVVLMLDSPESAIVCKACQALHQHVEKSEQNCLEIQRLDAVPRLLKLLSSADKATRAHAVQCLSVLAGTTAVRQHLYKLDCVSPLLALMQHEEELISQERASFTVSLLAGEYSFKVVLHSHSAHQVLITLLQSASDPDVQRNCVKSLCLLVEHYQSRPAVREAGGLPTVLELLSSEYPLVQDLALKTLNSCMQDAECRAAFREADGLTSIVTFLGNKAVSELHVLAVGVLSQCLEDTENMVALQSSGCLQLLTQHIADSSSPDMKRNAAMALARAARNSVNQKILHEQNVEKTFIDLLSSEDDGVCVAGSNGLAAMASMNSSRQLIGQLGGVEALVGVCGREESMAKAVGVQALAMTLQEAPANCKRLADCDGVEVLRGLLGDGQAQTRRFAAECVASMAPDDALRQDLVAGGVIPALVGSLGFADSAVQVAMAEAIGLLACDAAARQEFCACGGMASLLPLLRSSHEDVRGCAVWTLAVCSTSSEVAELACQSGALDVLEQLSKQSSVAHRGAVECALFRLLDSNLSTKYWVRGRLEQGDVLTACEFFDAGTAQSASLPFIPLTELVQRPLHMNMPVLTVNLLMPPTPPPSQPTEDTPLEGSQSNVSIGSRSKSRAQQAKGKKEKTKGGGGAGGGGEVESKLSEVVEESSGLLPPDPALWAHLSHAHSHIHPLSPTKSQVTELARFVSESMGGVVRRTGALGYELPAAQVQAKHSSNLLPLGEVTVGSFQHRALLFKVLCDHIGVACSLVRGEYGRHWNEVTLVDESSGRLGTYIVDLMFSPGQLMPSTSPQAVQYQHLV